MKQYTVRTGQNIYDVCLTLYGSIEGLIDLLVSNPSMDIESYGPSELKGKALTMDTQLKRGVILNYHEDIDINGYIKESIADTEGGIANGDHQYHITDRQNKDVRILIAQSGMFSNISVTLKTGSMTVDWGDCSIPETINVTDGEIVLEHIYNSSSDHQIKIFGTFTASLLDFTDCNGVVYPTSTIDTDELKTNNANANLVKLFNITGTPATE